MSRHHFLMTVSFLLLLLISASATRPEKMALLVGGWTPIKDLNDSHVKQVAKFAVGQYNTESKTNLELQKIISGATQVVSGTNYKLVLAVLDGSTPEKYEAVVFEKPGANAMNLISFKPTQG